MEVRLCFSFEISRKEDHASDSKPVTLYLNWMVGIKSLHYTQGFCWGHGSKRNVCSLLAGRSILGKTVPKVLSTARGRRPKAMLKTEGTDFPNMDRARLANNMFIFFFLWEITL